MAPHGTTNRYRHYACRCDLCRQAQNTTQRAYRNSRGLVDATPVRERLVFLRENGVRLTRVAELSGWSKQSLWAIADGRQEKCSADLAEDVLAVRAPWESAA
ncbi:hypothetical protein Bra3105_06550 [Brachybacterium halotolerans subsp. kimchii]|uniref:hypothetical protein n=1 Tax=Brachybacterium halotolerans TaxID=2795215 RepID=UPI001E348103|nr:hypothetical protein [Brachybacterium halotolerans]UEJ83966.1 hypothetical protein Bra3105_06550 [Brachybacterium halotolerans subsp. kimchii]